MSYCQVRGPVHKLDSTGLAVLAQLAGALPPALPLIKSAPSPRFAYSHQSMLG